MHHGVVRCKICSLGLHVLIRKARTGPTSDGASGRAISKRSFSVPDLRESRPQPLAPSHRDAVGGDTSIGCGLYLGMSREER